MYGNFKHIFKLEMDFQYRNEFNKAPKSYKKHETFKNKKIKRIKKKKKKEKISNYNKIKVYISSVREIASFLLLLHVE